MHSLTPSCDNQGRDLGTINFRPDCGSTADFQERSNRIPGSINFSVAGNLFELNLSADFQQAFCFIPPGTFKMGSSEIEDGRSCDENQVVVTLSQPFWLAKTTVTQAQWKAVMGNNPSYFKGMKIPEENISGNDSDSLITPIFKQGANLPVENVSWNDVHSFITKINKQQVMLGWKFDLPTEAQWEYACRAGEKGPYSGGSLQEVAWFNKNSGFQIHDVAQKKPNAWGLHDMHGNVWEWCADWYGYTLKGGVDPVGPRSGDTRVRRGGDWSNDGSYCRTSGRRLRGHEGYRSENLGFRLAIVPSI